MPSTAAPGLAIEEPHVSFPDAFQFTTIRHSFRFVNHGPREVVIEEGLGIKEGGRVTFSPARVAPGAGGTIDVAQDLGTNLGATTFRFAIVTDEPGVSRYRMSFSGFVLSAFAPEQPLLAFGRVLRGTPADRSLELFSREVDRLEVKGVEGAPDFLQVESAERAGLAGEGVVVRLRLRERPPLGLSTGHVAVSTNVPTQPKVLVNYAVQVFGDIQPDVHPVSFDLVRMGQPKTIDVRLTSRAGNAFEVKEVTDSLRVVEVRSEPCSGTGPGPCAVLHLTAQVEAPLTLKGVLSVRIAGDPEPIPLAYAGMVISPRAEVRELGAPSLDSLFAEQPDPVTTASTPARQAPATPVPPATPTPNPAPAATAKGTRLSWKARNDESLYGYVVYRADKEIGPFRRVSDVIRAQTQPKADHQYEFRDADARPGRTYFYYLDTISQRGLTERFSPVRAHTASAP